MCKENDLDLSLNGETFSALKNDFDTILGSTISNMTQRGTEEATITIKIGVSLLKTSVFNKGKLREITKPTFKHDISSVMQVKEKMSGQLAGNVELVWDEESKSFILRPIATEQTSMFDKEDDSKEDGEEGDDDECEFCVVEYPALPSGDPPQLPSGDRDAVDEDGDNYEYDPPEDE